MPNFTLQHQIHRPSAGNPPHPALILLHGRGTDEHDLLPLAAELDPRLFVITARAPFEFPYGGYVWYDLDPRGVGYPDVETLNASLGKVRSFVDEAKGEYPIDPARVFLGGFSNGATVAGVCALTDPGLVAGAAILSGYIPARADLPYRPHEAAGHPFFEGHGTFDPVIPIQWARAGKRVLESMPVQLTYQEYPMGHQIDRAELADLALWLTAAIDAGANRAASEPSQ